jgi:hypothetical protein
VYSDDYICTVILDEAYLPTTTARSPLMVPGSDFCGSVAPISFLPYLITPSPSQTYRNCMANLCMIHCLSMHANFLCTDEGPAYHRKYRARAEEVAQSIEERSFFEIMVVLLSKFFGWNDQLDGNKLEAFSLKSRHNLRNLRQDFLEKNKYISILLTPLHMYRDKTKEECVSG